MGRNMTGGGMQRGLCWWNEKGCEVSEKEISEEMIAKS